MEFLNKFTKKDLYFSLITGLTTGFIFWQILVFLKAPNFGLPSHTLWVIIVPILWILGVNLGYFLGQWLVFFNQFGKYAAIGFTNAAVDFGVLNLLIALSSVASGLIFTIFKTLSFITAVTHSYFWNRCWAFESKGENKGQEFFKFTVVNIIVALVNVGTASFVVNGVNPLFGLSENVWANVGAVAGTALAFTFNFIGFRMIVFKKKDDALSQIPPSNLQ